MTLSRTLRPLTVLIPSLLRGLVASFFQQSGLSCPLCPLYCHPIVHREEASVQCRHHPQHSGKREHMPNLSQDSLQTCSMSLLSPASFCACSSSLSFPGDKNSLLQLWEVLFLPTVYSSNLTNQRLVLNWSLTLISSSAPIFTEQHTMWVLHHTEGAKKVSANKI